MSLHFKIDFKCFILYNVKEVTHMDIYAKLKELLSKQVKKINLDSITPETKLEDLGLDSLDTAELLINIEQEFNLSEVSQEEMLEVKTIEDVKNLIEKKRNN